MNNYPTIEHETLPESSVQISGQEIEDVLKQIAKRKLVSSDSSSHSETGSQSNSDENQEEEIQRPEINLDPGFKQMKILAKKGYKYTGMIEIVKAIKAVRSKDHFNSGYKLKMDGPVKRFLFITVLLTLIPKFFLFTTSKYCCAFSRWYYWSGNFLLYHSGFLVVYPVLLRLKFIKGIIQKNKMFTAFLLYIVETRYLKLYYTLSPSNATVIFPIFVGTLAVDIALLLNLLFFKKTLNSRIVFVTTFLTFLVLCFYMLEKFFGKVDLRYYGHRWFWIALSALADALISSSGAALQILIFKERLADVDREIGVGDCFYLAFTGKLDALIKLFLLPFSKIFKKEQIVEKEQTVKEFAKK